MKMGCVVRESRRCLAAQPREAAIFEGEPLIVPEVGSLVLGQDLQVSYLGPDAAHYNFTLSESLGLKIEAPDAICTITPKGPAA